MKIQRVIHIGKLGYFGGNAAMIVEAEGFGRIEALRQGGLGIWACAQRPKMSREQQKQLDEALDLLWQKRTEGLFWSENLQRFVSIPASGEES